MTIRWANLPVAYIVPVHTDWAALTATPGQIIEVPPGALMAPIFVPPPIPRPEVMW